MNVGKLGPCLLNLSLLLMSSSAWAVQLLRFCQEKDFFFLPVVLGLLRLNTQRLGSAFGKGIFDPRVDLRHFTLSPGIYFFSPSSQVFRIQRWTECRRKDFFCNRWKYKGCNSLISFPGRKELQCKKLLQTHCPIILWLNSASCQRSRGEPHGSLLLLDLIKAFAFPGWGRNSTLASHFTNCFILLF